ETIGVADLDRCEGIGGEQVPRLKRFQVQLHPPEPPPGPPDTERNVGNLRFFAHVILLSNFEERRNVKGKELRDNPIAVRVKEFLGPIAGALIFRIPCHSRSSLTKKLIGKIRVTWRYSRQTVARGQAQLCRNIPFIRLRSLRKVGCSLAWPVLPIALTVPSPGRRVKSTFRLV